MEAVRDQKGTLLVKCHLNASPKRKKKFIH